ncbi:serine carboxypeptidase 24-like protein [Tanacetum coccineum]
MTQDSLVHSQPSGYDPCIERKAENGNTDSVVPVTATRFSLSYLNLTVKTQWYPWYINGQVGGWSEVYNGLTFATVRGAGHVPLLQPQRGFLIFQSFLAGKCRLNLLQVSKNCFQFFPTGSK